MEHTQRWDEWDMYMMIIPYFQVVSNNKSNKWMVIVVTSCCKYPTPFKGTYSCDDHSHDP